MKRPLNTVIFNALYYFIIVSDPLVSDWVCHTPHHKYCQLLPVNCPLSVQFQC